MDYGKLINDLYQFLQHVFFSGIEKGERAKASTATHTNTANI
ncbi:MAG: hypothetical protein JWR38_5140 [Mucilaginibacter sp.]|nr:hypothetical protein [Mucilaginibacter sp.]